MLRKFEIVVGLVIVLVHFSIYGCADLSTCLVRNSTNDQQVLRQFLIIADETHRSIEVFNQTLPAGRDDLGRATAVDPTASPFLSLLRGKFFPVVNRRG